MAKYFWTVFIGSILSYTSWAQNVTGQWYGVGKVELSGSSNSYLSELVLIQKGKSVTGELNYYFRDSLFKNKISGNFDAASRTLELNTTNLIYYKTSNTLTGVDCPMSGQFILRIAKTESVLSGVLFSNKDFRYTCPDINFKLKKHTDKEDDNTIPITKTEIKTEDTVAIKQPTAILAEEKLAPEIKQTINEFAKREKIFAREIEVVNDELKLEFYDNGAIDGDSISVFLNNKIILAKSKLDHRAIRLTIHLNNDLPYNELSMFAESLGYIPPNTAALIIYDGTKRYDLLMTSDFTKSSTIKLTKKK
jgi:hypothetical protein